MRYSWTVWTQTIFATQILMSGADRKVNSSPLPGTELGQRVCPFWSVSALSAGRQGQVSWFKFTCAVNTLRGSCSPKGKLYSFLGRGRFSKFPRGKNSLSASITSYPGSRWGSHGKDAEWRGITLGIWPLLLYTSEGEDILRDWANLWAETVDPQCPY